MNKFQYLNKRDEKGVFLSFSAYELAKNITDDCIKVIKSKDIYKILIGEFTEKYIELYYKKMIYEALLPIAHQFVIHQYDKKHFQEKRFHLLDASGFPCEKLLRKVWPDTDNSYSLSFSIRIMHRINKNLYLLNNSKKNFSKFFNHFIKGPKILKNKSSSGSNIAINYVEGFDTSKRSDLFWYRESLVDPRSIIIYYTNPYLMTRHDHYQKAVEVFEKNDIVQVKLWEWRDWIKSELYESILLQLKSIKSNDEIDLWLQHTAVKFVKRVTFWVKFFKHFNIKIHIDPIEADLETIIKQVAISLLGGVSIGKLRSYPIYLDGLFYGYYPNDIFFSWGLDSASRLNFSNPHINNIIISGFPYTEKFVSTDIKSNNEVIFKTGGNKFNILLLDSNHSNNDSIIQSITSSTMSLFYKVFLDWVVEDLDIGLIIKSKKSQFLYSLNNIIGSIKDIQNSTGRCVLIEDSFQKMPSSYLDNINIVVGTGIYFSSAIIECAIHGAKAIFFDYSNLRFHEKELYNWGGNKVIFHEFDTMFSYLKAYKNDPTSNPDLGDWSAYLGEFDPFRDQKGGERIGTYIHWLKNAFDQGLEKQEAIERANALYAKVWGEDKIYYGSEKKWTSTDFSS